ncbi:hypothetical protein AAVH_17167 [Aphelenchoides avenae]|nr:hypothetical protein AAVH_17167 [Aphelenchus avenae]
MSATVLLCCRQLGQGSAKPKLQRIEGILPLHQETTCRRGFGQGEARLERRQHRRWSRRDRNIVCKASQLKASAQVHLVKSSIRLIMQALQR